MKTFNFNNIEVIFEPMTVAVYAPQFNMKASFVVYDGFKQDGTIETDRGSIQTTPEFTAKLNAEFEKYSSKNLKYRIFGWLDGLTLHVFDSEGKPLFGSDKMKDIANFAKFAKSTEQEGEISVSQLEMFKEIYCY